MVINTRGSSAWQRILRVRLALLAIVALLLGTSAIAQEFARFEARSPDIPPSIGTWEYVRSGAGEVCRDPNVTFSSLEAVAACVIDDYIANQGACDGTYSIGSMDAAGFTMGYVDAIDARVYYTIWFMSGPPESACVPSEPFEESIWASRSVSCDDFPGYSAGTSACESGTTVEVFGPAPVADDSGPKACVGDPCNAATGDVYLTEVDFSSPTLKLARTYHSFAASGTDMGAGWSHSFSGYLTISTISGSPEMWVGPTGDAEPLVEISGGLFVSTTGSGIKVADAEPNANGSDWYLYQPDGSRETYSNVGRLLKIRAVNGLETVVGYDNGRLDTVTGPFGHTLEFNYDAQGLIASITDPTGEVISYIYETNTANDAVNNLERVTYPDTTYREYLYTNSSFPHHLTGIRDENGDQFVSWGYDAQGRVVSNALGENGDIGAITLEYDTPAVSQTRVTDSEGTQRTFTFSGTENPWAWRIYDDPEADTYTSLQEALEAARAECGSLCWNVQATGRALGYTPATSDSERFRKLDSADTEGDGPVYAYNSSSGDPARRLDTMTDERGIETDYDYDAYHLTARTEAGGTSDERTTSYSYLENTSDLPTLVTTPSVTGGGNSKAVTTTYVSGGPPWLVESVTVSGYDPAQPSTLLERTTTLTSYDADTDPGTADDRQPGRIDGPRTDANDFTDLEYWDESSPGVACTTTGGGACGQIRSVTNALGHVTEFDEYYADGSLKQMTDPNGVVAVYTYDLRRRLHTVIQTPPTGPSRTTTFDYDDAGQLDKVTLPNGQFLEYSWTDAHLLDFITDNLGHKIDYSYDSRGNRSGEQLKDPSGTLRKNLQMVYDVRNRLDTLTHGGSPAADVSFDEAGVLEDETDAAGGFTDYDYDALRRLVAVVDAEDGSAFYGYNVHDEVESVEAPNGALTTYVYDDLGNLRSTTSPDTGTTTYSYDAAGNRLSQTDANGVTVSYTYDALNRLTDIDYPGSTLDVDLTYDQGTNQKGHLTTMADGSGTTTFEYDVFGNLTEESKAIDGNTHVTAYTYDAADLLESITYPSGRTVDYTRNALGEVAEVETTYDGTTVTVADDIAYEPFGPLLELTFGNGLALSRSSDQQYRLTAQTTGAVQDLEFILDDAGNIDEIADGVNAALSQEFTQDALHRIVSEDGAYGTNDYTYDANGNRLTKVHGVTTQTLTYTANSNRLATHSGNTVSRDAAGNTTADPTENLAFTYGSHNRMVEAYVGAVLKVSYVYNGQGQRVKKVEATGAQRTIVYHYGISGELLGETIYSSAGAKIGERDYLWLDSLPLAQSERVFSSGVVTSSQFVYIHADQLNTPRLATNGSQTVVWRWDSDAFGVGAADPDPDADTNLVNIRLRFPGQYLDDETGVHYNYFRDYDAVTGRYVQSDPIGLGGGLNPYLYAAGNPLALTDRFGLAPGDTFPSQAAAAADVADYQSAIDDHNSWWFTRLFGDQSFGIPYETDCGWTWNLTSPAGGAPVFGAVAALGATRGLSFWGNLKSLARHFRDHGADFGARSADDYAREASDFFRRSQADRLPTKIDADGVIRVYDPKTNTFGAFNPDGTTRTFFKPTSPTYFDRQPGSQPWGP